MIVTRVRVISAMPLPTVIPCYYQCSTTRSSTFSLRDQYRAHTATVIHYSCFSRTCAIKLGYTRRVAFQSVPSLHALRIVGHGTFLIPLYRFLRNLLIRVTRLYTSHSQSPRYTYPLACSPFNLTAQSQTEPPAIRKLLSLLLAESSLASVMAYWCHPKHEE